MTAKGRATIAAYEEREARIQREFAEVLRKRTPADRKATMIAAGILTKKGKLAAIYRVSPAK